MLYTKNISRAVIKKPLWCWNIFRMGKYEQFGSY